MFDDLMTAVIDREVNSSRLAVQLLVSEKTNVIGVMKQCFDVTNFDRSIEMRLLPIFLLLLMLNILTFSHVQYF